VLAEPEVAHRLGFGGTALSGRNDSIERHIADLRRYACALLGSAADADELVQETLVRALARQHFWTRIRDMRAYLFAILHNVHIDRLTRGHGRAAEVTLDEHQDGLTEPAGQLLSLELRDVVRAVARLPFEQRAVLLLIALEGMSYQTAADVLDVPVGTVMSRLSRARAALHHMLEEGWPAARTDAPVRR
jgi:RNA polymerase sigma-70 factor (ECF subfamily)